MARPLAAVQRRHRRSSTGLDRRHTPHSHVCGPSLPTDPAAVARAVPLDGFGRGIFGIGIGIGSGGMLPGWLWFSSAVSFATVGSFMTS